MTPHNQLIEPEVRRDLRVATAIAICATVLVHISAYIWFPADLNTMEVFLFAMYGLMCVNLLLDTYAPIKALLLYEVLSSGFNAYWVTAACSPLSYMQISFLVLGLRSYLLFRRKKRWLIFAYVYYASLFLVGHFANFWLPFIPEPIISPQFADSMADAVLIFQVPLLFLITQTTIRRAHKEQTLIERFFQRNEALRKTSSALKQELTRRDQLLHQVFDRAFDAQFLVDEESFEILDCNEQALELLEVDEKKSLIGKSCGSFQATAMTETRMQAIVGKLAKNQQVTVELECRTFKGKFFWGSVAIRRFQLENHFYHILRIVDISATKKAEIMLRDKNAELERYIDSNLQLENFAFSASHDLREPLRSIIAFAQLLEKRYGDKLDEKGGEFLQHIITSGRNMYSLVRALLTYSRIHESDANIQVISFPDMVKTLQADLSSLLQEKKAFIKTTALPERVKGDKVRLQQLWQNLLTNALKFVPEDRIPKIELGLYEEEPTCWTFYLRDNGIGIAPEFQENIFHLFKRLHSKEQYNGNGIGLALCRRIVQQHGGKIWVDSEPGVGSTFYFTLAKEPVLKTPELPAQLLYQTPASHPKGE